MDSRSDVLALTSVVNIAYCTGFEGVFDDEPAHVALVSDTELVLLTDSRYAETIRQAAVGSAWRIELVTAPMATAVGEYLAASRARILAIEASTPHSRFQALAGAFAGDVVEATDWVEEIRTVKDANELAAIARSQELTDRAFDHLLAEEVLRLGVAERDIALELEFFMRREGSDGVAFPPIVASGPNAALPHAIPGTRRLETGDFVVLDFGARVGGYCADMTRTVVIGSASERQRTIYGVVRAANAAGESALRAGVTAREVDAAARSVIAGAGLAEYFGHGLGHGVGREIHELPKIGPRIESSIPAGAVVTVEPGIYIPGFGGVRIESLAVVQQGGARVLTRSTTDLLEL
jgi:Xaa-Pro aminopeptidase